MQGAYVLWAVYSGHILGREVEDAEAKFDALSQAEQEAWVAVVLASAKDE